MLQAVWLRNRPGASRQADGQEWTPSTVRRDIALSVMTHSSLLFPDLRIDDVRLGIDARTIPTSRYAVKNSSIAGPKGEKTASQHACPFHNISKDGAATCF
jgi:hypothetical protein